MSTVDWQAEARYVVNHYDATVRAAGLGEVWDRLLADEHSPTRTLLLGTVGALAAYMDETGTRAASP